MSIAASHAKSFCTIGKRDGFFNYWYKTKTDVHCIVRLHPNGIINSEIKQHVGTEMDDELKERNRVVCWSRKILKLGFLVGEGGIGGKV